MAGVIGRFLIGYAASHIVDFIIDATTIRCYDGPSVVGSIAKAPVKVFSSNGLALRDSPDGKFSSKGPDHQTEWDLLEMSNDGKWGKINYQGKIGWVNLRYTNYGDEGDSPY